MKNNNLWSLEIYIILQFIMAIIKQRLIHRSAHTYKHLTLMAGWLCDRYIVRKAEWMKKVFY